MMQFLNDHGYFTLDELNQAVEKLENDEAVKQWQQLRST